VQIAQSSDQLGRLKMIGVLFDKEPEIGL